MPRYLVETKHTVENCALIVGEVHTSGYLNHFDWGCDAGVHCGWAIIEASNEDEVLLSVPLIVRSQARAVRLTKFTAEDIEHARSHS